MPSQGWQEALITATADGTALTNSTTATSILPTPAIYTLPANFINRIGQGIRIRAAGRISNIVTTPGTLTLSVRFGAIIVATSQAMQLNAVAKTNVTWVLDWALTSRTVGSVTAATMFHTGQWQSESVVGSPLPAAGGSGSFTIPAATPAVGTGFDSTVANAVNLFAAFSIANAGNSIQLHQYALESLN